MCVLTVFSLITKLSAISRLLRPCATRATTSSSRSVRSPGGDGRRGPASPGRGPIAASITLRSASGCRRGSPRCTARMASTSSSGVTSFSR